MPDTHLIENSSSRRDSEAASGHAAGRQRNIVGNCDITACDVIRNPIARSIQLGVTHHNQGDARVKRDPHTTVADQNNEELIAVGNAVNLLLHRACVRIDIKNRWVFRRSLLVRKVWRRVGHALDIAGLPTGAKCRQKRPALSRPMTPTRQPVPDRHAFDCRQLSRHSI